MAQIKFSQSLSDVIGTYQKGEKTIESALSRVIPYEEYKEALREYLEKHPELWNIIDLLAGTPGKRLALLSGGAAGGLGTYLLLRKLLSKKKSKKEAMEKSAVGIGTALAGAALGLPLAAGFQIGKGALFGAGAYVAYRLLKKILREEPKF